VPTILSNGVPKPALVGWAKKVTAEYAVNNLPMLNDLASHDPKGAIDWLKGAAYRDRDVAADLGTAIHDAVEDVTSGRAVDLDSLPPVVRASVEQFVQFVDVVQPLYLASEAVVVNDTHGYAGTLDAIVTTSHPALVEWFELDPVTLLLDYKSGKGVYPETGLQLAAYRNANRIILGDGTDMEMLPTEGAAVLHIRPRSWKLMPVRAGSEEYAAFVRASGVAHWLWNNGDVVGPPLAAGRGPSLEVI
jgi:hypothetical protein